jgi:hypothetical protein
MAAGTWRCKDTDERFRRLRATLTGAGVHLPASISGEDPEQRTLIATGGGI